MGKQAQSGAGAIYRFFEGELVQLFDHITIPNAICFSPDGKFAYFTDTPTRLIMRQPLDNKGWPHGDPEVFIDLRGEGLNPDGAVIDQEGCLWNAQWGASRVARYDHNGSFLCAFELPALQPSCPGFGGPDLDQMFVTSAAEDMAEVGPNDGQLFALSPGVKGQAEHALRAGV